jgi:hypothetical protein
MPVSNEALGASRLAQDIVDRYFRRKLRIVDHTLDDAELETRCPLDNGRHTGGQPQHSAGQLDALPCELIDQVLSLLDVPSLTTLRRVNRRAMSLVDSLPPYRHIWTHCPEVLRAIISIDASHFDCNTLYKTSTTAQCSSCDRFGGYLYLITCKRVCYLCFSRKEEYLPVTLTAATRRSKILKRTLMRLPNALSLPGKYTATAQLLRSRLRLLDRSLLLDHTSQVATDGLREPRERKTTEPRRIMAVIAAPYIHLSGQNGDWGLYCRLCRDMTTSSAHFRLQYVGDDILRHLRERHAAELARA